MKHTLFAFGLCLGLSTLKGFSQEVQWASKVINFSTEFTDLSYPKQYSAQQALGKPSVLPEFGFTPAAWSPASEDGPDNEFIHVGFEKPMNVQQLVVNENNNPGAITVIDFFDTGGEYHRVYENPSPTSPGVVGRLFSFTCDRTPYLVVSVRIVLKNSAVKGYNHIDAIGIADHKDPITVKVNLAPNMQTGLVRENLGPNVNSLTDEICPVISVDGKTLYYTRQNHPENTAPVENQDVWYSDILPDGTFSPAKNIGSPINNKDNSSVLTALPDNNSLLVLNVYKPDGTGDKGVSFTRKSANGWELPQALMIQNYYNDNPYGEYSLAPNGKVLVSTMQRKDGYGSKDIHVSFLKDDGTWSEPKNVGTVLNTAASESSPFVAADGVTMYFSSPGHPGYGKNDMFITRRLDDTWLNWSEPINLGPELNTPNWDAYYSIPANGEYAYCVSYQNSIGAADIFRIKLPDAIKPKPVVRVSGKTLDKKTGLPIGAKISYENLETGQEMGIAVSNPKDGSYAIVLPAGTNYGFLAETPNYASVTANLNLPVVDKFKEFNQDLYLVPLEKGAVIRMNNIFFDVNKSELKKISFPELNRIVELMKERPTLKIQIGGHTDSDADEAYNLDLSNRRAASVYNYLVKAGIEPARLTSKGYGEAVPQVPNTTPENKAINRRVEFTILEI
jgi:outer membrane protein OmpA-like peptidoglycan-associated protein